MWFLLQGTEQSWEDLLYTTRVCEQEEKTCNTDSVWPTITGDSYDYKVGVFELTYHADWEEP